MSASIAGMGRIGFFEMLVSDDVSWREWDAIDSAHDRADAAHEAAGAALVQGSMIGETVGSLRKIVMAQAGEIRRLQTAVAVLVKVLEESKVVDANVLDYRIEAATLDAEAEATQEAATVTCAECAARIPKARSNVTEFGIVCDRCFASR